MASVAVLCNTHLLISRLDTRNSTIKVVTNLPLLIQYDQFVANGSRMRAHRPIAISKGSWRASRPRSRSLRKPRRLVH